MTYSKFITASAFAILFFVRTGSTQQNLNGPRQVINGRPLAETASQLQEARGKIVTYEEPVLTWSGDLQEVPGKSGSKGYLYPKELTVSLPPDLSTQPDLGIALNKALEAYHSQTSSTRFKLLSSKWGYHIVPLQAHNSSGVLMPAGSLLDAQIYVASADRTAKGQLDALGRLLPLPRECPST